MPKISDDKRAARRAQILEAAWICFQREGLHATTMDDIIRTSKLSAGAVYSYYPSKDELILAAVTTSLAQLSELLMPLLKVRPVPSPDRLVREITEAITNFTARDGYDLKRIALLGWSEAQRNESLRTTMSGFYRTFRDHLEEAARSWMKSGIIRREESSAGQVARLLLAIVLGYVVQSAISGDVEPTDLESGIRMFGAPPTQARLP